MRDCRACPGRAATLRGLDQARHEVCTPPIGLLDLTPLARTTLETKRKAIARRIRPLRAH